MGGISFLVLYPRSSNQVAAIVNWAYQARKNVRVQGHRYSSSPIVVSDKDDPAHVVIMDFTRYINKLRIGSLSVMVPNTSSITNANTVIAETGASLEDFLSFSEQNGLSLATAPSIGDATIGGILAVGGHGVGMPPFVENLEGIGYTYGSMSNSITKFEAVVWDEDAQKYTVKTFTRTDPDSSAFLVHLGRAIITEVTLLVGNNYNMRCISRVDIPGSELFAHPRNSSGLRTMSSFLAEYERMDVIWYPFVTSPWVKIWEVVKTKPAGSRPVRHPFNYQFHSTLDNPQSPGTEFGPESMENLIRGLTETRAWDIWGLSKNTILFLNRTSMSLVHSGFVVLTNKGNIQYVLHDITDFYVHLLNEYAEREIYPVDQYLQLQVTGLDDPRDIPVPGAVVPDISPTSPIRSRPDLNVGVWVNTITTTRRPYSHEFMKRFEEFAYVRFNGRDALVRPEWSKNWGHSTTGPFGNPAFIQETIPEVFGAEKWNHAIETLNKHDPHHVISNKFLSELMVSFQGSQLSRSKYNLKYGWGKPSSGN